MRSMIPCVCQPVCHASNMAERIEVLRGAKTLGNPRNVVLDGSHDFLPDSMRLSPNYFGYLLNNFFVALAICSEIFVRICDTVFERKFCMS